MSHLKTNRPVITLVGVLMTGLLTSAIALAGTTPSHKTVAAGLDDQAAAAQVDLAEKTVEQIVPWTLMASVADQGVTAAAARTAAQKAAPAKAQKADTANAQKATAPGAQDECIPGKAKPGTKAGDQDKVSNEDELTQAVWGPMLSLIEQGGKPVLGAGSTDH